jgi:hypothetical protein
MPGRSRHRRRRSRMSCPQRGPARGQIGPAVARERTGTPGVCPCAWWNAWWNRSTVVVASYRSQRQRDPLHGDRARVDEIGSARAACEAVGKSHGEWPLRLRELDREGRERGPVRRSMASVFSPTAPMRPRISAPHGSCEMPRHFLSFSEWADAGARDAWKSILDFAKGLVACRELCDDFLGVDYSQVTTSDLERADASRSGAATEEHCAAVETAFVRELELDTHAIREPPRAAAHHDRGDEPMELVDQTGLDRPGGEPGTAHGEVAVRRRLQSRTSSGSKSRSIPVFAVDAVTNVVDYTHLVGGPGSPRSPSRMVAGRRPRARSPVRHHLVHPPPVQVGADRPLEVVDERGGPPRRVRPSRSCPLDGDAAVE